MKSIKKLVFDYLNTKDVYSVERILDELLAETNADNVITISELMLSEANFHEMDLVIYLEESTSIKNEGLKAFIDTLILRFDDKEALSALKTMSERLAKPLS